MTNGAAWKKCRTGMRAATGEAFSDAELDDILDRLVTRGMARREAVDPDAIALAAKELTRDEVMTALLEKRLKVASERAKKIRAEILAALPGDEAQKLRAYNVGASRNGEFTGFSVDAEGRARTLDLWGDVERGLRKAGVYDHMAKFLGGGDRAFERQVAREMSRLNGGKVDPTGNPDALKAAEVLNAALEKGRLLQNDQGAWIGKLEGYVVRQSHDRLRVAGGFWREFRAAGPGALVDFKAARRAAARRAFVKWRDTIAPLLDERTFEGLTKSDLVGDEADLADELLGGIGEGNDADLREAFLQRVWFDIVTGRHEVRGGAEDVGEFRPPPSKARAVSRSRVLHFKDPDAWMDYHEQFGPAGGSLLSVAMQDLERAASNAALMRRWGPAPDAAFEHELGRLEGQARARGDEGAATNLFKQARRSEFGELTGEANRPDSLRAAMIGRAIRLDQALAKLGGMVLSALGSDQALAAQAFRRAGGKYLDGYKGAFAGITRLQGQASKDAADLVDVGARSAIADLSMRFSASDGALGFMANAQRAFYKINGFRFLADGQRRGMAGMLAGFLGQQSTRPWEAIEIGLRETLERHGVDARAWDLVRAGAMTMDDGRLYLTADAIDGIGDNAILNWAGLTKKKQRTPDAARRARQDLAVRMQTVFSEFLDDTLTEPRARERASMYGGFKPGTVWGEAVRCFMQFWSFPMAVLGRHVAPAMKGYAGQKPVALLAHLIVATTLGGFFSMQAKQLVKGREFRDPTDPETWVAALMQGGGLGIYGDFLFGEANRNGAAFGVGALGGPAVGEFERFATILRGLINPDPDVREDSWHDLPADALQAAKANTPGLNLFYVRWALDYLVLWRLQEAVSPGYLARYEKRVEEEEGAEFFISPAEAIQ